MNKYKNLDIYLNIKKKSIGIDKKCRYKKIKVRGRLKKDIKVLYSVFKFGILVSCNTISNVDSASIPNNDILLNNNYNGYSYSDVTDFERNRVYKLMNNYELNEYTLEDDKRKYNYDKNIYENIPQLDESYLYGFYLISDEKTLDIISNSFGYDNFNNYIISKGYNTKEEWIESSLNDISVIMQSRKGKNK